MKQMLNRKLLLLSNSTNPSEGYLQHAALPISQFLGQQTKRVLFIPYAQVLPSLSDYALTVRRGFQAIGFQLDSIHETRDEKSAITNAEAIVVGGGNTFNLLHNLYERDLLDAIRTRASEGIPYIGWSAGANVACPSIKTTNDMPIIQPQSLNALGLIPFQINPHFTDSQPSGYMGETRVQRILEFVEINANLYVVGLRDGSMLEIEGRTIRLVGNKPVSVFIKGSSPVDYSPADPLHFLLASEGQ
jgi:dipeptidase E